MRYVEQQYATDDTTIIRVRTGWVSKPVESVSQVMTTRYEVGGKKPGENMVWVLEYAESPPEGYRVSSELGEQDFLRGLDEKNILQERARKKV